MHANIFKQRTRKWTCLWSLLYTRFESLPHALDGIPLSSLSLVLSLGVYDDIQKKNNSSATKDDGRTM